MPAPAEHALSLVQHLRACLAQGPRASVPLQSLAQALAVLPARALPAVDDHLRSNLFSYGDGWCELTPDELRRFAGRGEAWGFVALASCHPNGHLREAALRALGRQRDARSLPFIVLRLNDWVVEVRRAAHFAMGGFLETEQAPALVAALPLLVALERQRRADHGAVLARIQGLLRQPDCREAVLAGCASDNRHLRRSCYRLALDTEGTDPSALLEQALADPDPAIRVWAMRTAATDVSRPWALRLALRALGNRSVQVRRLALGAVAAVLAPDELRRLSEQALLDENVTARWQARVLRLSLGPLDLPAFYREALGRPATTAGLRGALLGLGESGSRTDEPFVRAHLVSGPISVRRAALRALAGLEPLSTVEPFLVAMTGPQPGLSKEGRRALEPRLGQVPMSTLAAIVRSNDVPAHARRNAVSLAAGLSKWDAVPILVDATASPEDAVRTRGRVLLQGWWARYNRSFLIPSHTQLDRLDEALGRAAGSLGWGCLRELEAIVRNARTFAKR